MFPPSHRTFSFLSKTGIFEPFKIPALIPRPIFHQPPPLQLCLESFYPTIPILMDIPTTSQLSFTFFNLLCPLLFPSNNFSPGPSTPSFRIPKFPDSLPAHIPFQAQLPPPDPSSSLSPPNSPQLGLKFCTTTIISCLSVLWNSPLFAMELPSFLGIPAEPFH